MITEYVPKGMKVLGMGSPDAGEYYMNTAGRTCIQNYKLHARRFAQRLMARQRWRL